MISLKTRRHSWFAGLALGVLTLSAMANNQPVQSDEPLQPEARHEDIGALVTQFIQKSHYKQITVDDDFSSLVLDRYIESLDGNKMYFLASDIEYFEQYRYELDDIVKSKPLDPVYDMFRIYRTRVRERLDFAMTVLETEPDFSLDEEFRFDRSEMPWAETTAELDQIWQHRVKNDALRHVLDDSPDLKNNGFPALLRPPLPSAASQPAAARSAAAVARS